MYPFKKWNPNLHVQALVECDFVGCIAELRVRFENLIDPISETLILMSQLVSGTCLSGSFRIRRRAGNLVGARRRVGGGCNSEPRFCGISRNSGGRVGGRRAPAVRAEICRLLWTWR